LIDLENITDSAKIAQVLSVPLQNEDNVPRRVRIEYELNNKTEDKREEVIE